MLIIQNKINSCFWSLARYRPRNNLAEFDGWYLQTERWGTLFLRFFTILHRFEWEAEQLHQQPKHILKIRIHQSAINLSEPRSNELERILAKLFQLANDFVMLIYLWTMARKLLQPETISEPEMATEH